MTEQQLMAAYRNTRAADAEPLAVEPCACGGMLTAPPRDALRVRLEVERHQSTPGHQQWWTRTRGSYR